MKGIKRVFIDLKEDKIKEKYNYPNIDECIWCIKTKWNPFYTNWKQGFDSDCTFHCSDFNKCSKIFYDEECMGKDHFKLIIIPTDKEICWLDREVEITGE